MLARIRSVLVISDAPAFSFGEAKENAEWQLQICTTYQPFSSFSKTPQGQKRYSRPQVWDESMLASWCHPNSGNFYTHARRTSFPGSLQKPFSKAAFSLRRRGSGTASASLRVIGSIFCFSSSYANPDRRAAARGSAFLPRPDWSHRGRCTYRTGGACA